MAYQRLLEDCMEHPPGYRMSPVVINNEKWLEKYENQVNDLDLLLGDQAHLTYKDKKILVNYNDTLTFRIEHLKIVKDTEEGCEGEEDLLELNLQYENNIYIESIKGKPSNDVEISSLPVYTEKADTEESKVLGNFWISFTEHGLPHVLESLGVN